MYGSFLKKETNEDSRSKQRNLIQGIKRRGSNAREEIITEIKQFYPWHIISNPIFNVDVDETYFNKDKFFMQIQKLYDWLGYDDFNETLLLQYYTAYIDLHKT